MQNALRDGDLKTSGMVFAKILPSSISLFDKDNTTIRQRVRDKLRAFFTRFFNMG